MNWFEAKQEARRQRLEAAADRARAEAQSRFNAARKSIEHIPPGQPILVGHHSERHHRRDLARHDSHMHAGIDAQKRAADLASRAAGVGNGGVSSDDPDATEKLREQLEQREALQAKMRAANAAVRKGDDEALRALGFSDKVIAELKKPDFAGRIGFADYQLSNNNAQIRRLRERMAHLERARQAEPKETLHNSGVRLVENVEENRMQLFFPGKPSEKVRANLKSRGFRWSPMAGAWQRHLSNGARWAAQCVVESLTPNPAEQAALQE